MGSKKTRYEINELNKKCIKSKYSVEEFKNDKYARLSQFDVKWCINKFEYNKALIILLDFVRYVYIQTW